MEASTMIWWRNFNYIGKMLRTDSKQETEKKSNKVLSSNLEKELIISCFMIIIMFCALQARKELPVPWVHNLEKKLRHATINWETGSQIYENSFSLSFFFFFLGPSLSTNIPPPLCVYKQNIKREIRKMFLWHKI